MPEKVTLRPTAPPPVRVPHDSARHKVAVAVQLDGQVVYVDATHRDGNWFLAREPHPHWRRGDEREAATILDGFQP